MLRESNFVRDPAHWLRKLSPQEWIEAGLKELGQAREALSSRERSRASASLKRAAGMALNGALIVVPRPEWGRSYTEHLQALSGDETAPAEVRKAAALLLEWPQSRELVVISTERHNERLVEAARTVMAHAYALIYGSTGKPGKS
jgi:HEPN domain-containing protein